MSGQQWTWQPVEHGYILRGDGVSLAIFDNVLGYPPKLWLSGANFREMLELPDDLRLCRRVPAPAAGVPVEVAAILQAALIVYQTECAHLGDFEHLQMAVNARDWLDSQPQPGQTQEE